VKASADPNNTALDRFDADATPQNAYEALDSLPSDSANLLAAVDHQIRAAGGTTPPMFTSPGVPPQPTTKGGKEFAYLVNLLWNAAEAVPPAGEAAVYEAMASIPGISTQSVTDVTGRAAIGVSDDGGYRQLLLDPHTYQILGLRLTSAGYAPTGATDQVPPNGTLVASMAWTNVKAVRGPGLH
jgi:hypothetical protein